MGRDLTGGGDTVPAVALGDQIPDALGRLGLDLVGVGSAAPAPPAWWRAPGRSRRAGRRAGTAAPGRGCCGRPGSARSTCAGSNRVTAALAAPLTIGPVTTARIALTTARYASSGLAPAPASRAASPVSRAAASASSTGHNARARVGRSARRCRCGAPRSDHTWASQDDPAGSGELRDQRGVGQPGGQGQPGRPVPVLQAQAPHRQLRRRSPGPVQSGGQHAVRPDLLRAQARPRCRAPGSPAPASPVVGGAVSVGRCGCRPSRCRPNRCRPSRCPAASDGVRSVLVGAGALQRAVRHGHLVDGRGGDRRAVLRVLLHPLGGDPVDDRSCRRRSRCRGSCTDGRAVVVP